MGEWTITRRVCARLPTAAGEFQLQLYTNGRDDKEHLALIKGEVAGRSNVLVRIHSECFTGDVLGSQRCDCGEQLDQSLRQIAQEGQGVLIYLRQEGRGIGLLKKLHAYNLQDLGYDTVDANLLLGHRVDERDYTMAALILKDLGVRSVRLLTNNPLKIKGLKTWGIPVSSRVPLPARITDENAVYLLTKVQRMNHLLDLNFLSPALANRRNGSAPYGKAASPPLFPDEEGIQTLLQRVASHCQQKNRPFVTLSYAQSVDGCIAVRPGQPLALSGRQSLVLTHKLRATHEAILVGIGTVLADNPRLTVRLVPGRNPQPIVADSHLRFPLNAKLLQNPSLPPWIATSEQADEKRQKVLEAAGARVLRLPTNARGQVDLRALLQRLGQTGIASLMVEGGARIITSFLSERLVDHMVLTVSPLLVGGMHAVRRLGQSGPVRLPRLHNLRYQRLEEDLILWGDPVWEEA